MKKNILYIFSGMLLMSVLIHFFNFRVQKEVEAQCVNVSGTLTCADVIHQDNRTGDQTCAAWGGACVSYGNFGRGFHAEFYNWHCGWAYPAGGDAGFSWRCCK